MHSYSDGGHEMARSAGPRSFCPPSRAARDHGVVERAPGQCGERFSFFGGIFISSFSTTCGVVRTNAVRLLRVCGRSCVNLTLVSSLDLYLLCV